MSRTVQLHCHRHAFKSSQHIQVIDHAGDLAQQRSRRVQRYQWNGNETDRAGRAYVCSSGFQRAQGHGAVYHAAGLVPALKDQLPARDTLYNVFWKEEYGLPYSDGAGFGWYNTPHVEGWEEADKIYMSSNPFLQTRPSGCNTCTRVDRHHDRGHLQDQLP